MKPKILKLELTSRCNLDCVFCLHSKIRRKAGDMDLEMAKRVTLEAMEMGVEEVQPQFYGESTMHPDMAEYCSWAKGQGLRVVFYTNGTMPFAHLEADTILVSVDYGDKATAESVRTHIDFDAVVRNVQDALKSNSIGKMILRATECEENAGTMGAIEAFWRGLGVTRFVSYREAPVSRGNDGTYPVSDTYDCPRVSDQIVVLSSGHVGLCCCDWHGDHKGDSVHDMPLRQAWEGGTMDENRKAVLAHDWLAICSTCGFRNRDLKEGGNAV